MYIYMYTFNGTMIYYACHEVFPSSVEAPVKCVQTRTLGFVQ